MKSLFSKASVVLPNRLDISSDALPRLQELEHVVAIGGGHGLGRLLSSLAFLEERLTGIVATTDNGGSTGRLRTETGCIAWGDLRNCLNQLCSEPTLGRLLFEYRFENSGSLSGHNLGNLMLLALDQLCARPLDAVELIRNVLDVKSEIIPMAEQSTSLIAHMPGGKTISGETDVNHIDIAPEMLALDPPVNATAEAITAIEHADLILVGPGSFLTSIMPPLLFPEIVEAIQKASGPRVLIANVGEEHNIAGHWTLDTQLKWMQQVLGDDIIDAVLWPSNRGAQEVENCLVFESDLRDTSREELHGRNELLIAIELLLEKLHEV